MRDEKYITKIVAASLLGDASITYAKSKNPCFSINLISEHKDHLDYLADVLAPVTKTRMDIKPGGPCIISGKETSRREQTRLRSQCLPFFQKFRERMYPMGHKVVDPHYLTLLDWEFLAVWYMQDGHLSAYYVKGKNPQYSLGIATHSFSYADNHFLRIQLKEKLNLDWSVNAHTNTSGTRSYKLKLSATQIDYFCENIKPYIQPSFEYKVSKETTLERIDALKTKRDDIVSSHR